jgi:hypothetical protein
MGSAIFDQFINAIFPLQVWGIFKILLVLGLFVYLMFALIIIRQVDLMTGVLSGRLNPGIRIAGYIHLGFAVLVLICALLFL